MKQLLYRISCLTASLALMVTAMNINSTCLYAIHQPQLPKEAAKLRKF